MIEFFVSYVIGVIFGCCLGYLVVKHLFNNNEKPLTKTEKISTCEIYKEFDKEIKHNERYWSE